MAHRIDLSTGRPAIAYTGQPPWHELGQELEAGAGIDKWTVAAGLDWEVLRSPVQFHAATAFRGPLQPGCTPTLHVRGRDVLYRGGTGAPLGIVSDKYSVVQPTQVMGFFSELVKAGKCQLETAGALSGGRQIWALAKMNEGKSVITGDVVRPYLLLTTSFDGSLATTAKLTAIRVVCHNTLSIALRHGDAKTSEPVGAVVKVNHALEFDAHEVRMQLDLFTNSFEEWMSQTRHMAKQKIDEETASRMVLDVIAELPFKPKGGRPGDPYPYPPSDEDLMKTRAYRRIMALFNGKALGSNLTEAKTRWQFVNSVTQWIDHERGNNAGSRLSSALFGIGESVKRKAYALAMEDEPSS